MYQLSNGEIRIGVNKIGAELRSLQDEKTGREYMWNGDPKYWERIAPILFPQVGNCKNKELKYEGTSYPMSQHGFARDMEFALISQTDDTMWFGLDATEETLRRFPFLFRLELGYRIAGRVVEVLWKVINQDKKTMYFSIGGHPAFLCPFHEGQAQTDCYLWFDTPNQVKSRRLAPDGLIGDVWDTYSLEEGYLPIGEGLFDHDALIIENQPIHSVALADAHKQRYVTMKFDMPLFGVWSPPKKHAPFVCLEPWCGRSDHTDFSGTLKEQEFVNQLEAGQEFHQSYTIEI